MMSNTIISYRQTGWQSRFRIGVLVYISLPAMQGTVRGPWVWIRSLEEMNVLDTAFFQHYKIRKR
ncbi:hypothetical protein FKX85_20190 [Echinicola soli]|uniref:Uncharacterized protein n=1 Tax=Echinicola soli TaxID=2591634 RepID=A0A514CN16_9BACT|nr:hypothetical protein [Echinicola soli]QDH81223.1 hypothetical protein FKX85_20190 [Echinicola soli]